MEFRRRNAKFQYVEQIEKTPHRRNGSEEFVLC